MSNNQKNKVSMKGKKLCIRIVDSTESLVNYGILLVENATNEEVQDKIYEIKNSLDYDWVVSDVMNLLPAEWKAEYYSSVDVCEI